NTGVTATGVFAEPATYALDLSNTFEQTAQRLQRWGVHAMVEKRFDGKVAIVTGAGGGLGKAYATLLAARGAKVLVNDLGGDHVGEGRDASYAEVAAVEIQAKGGIAEANGDSVATSAGAEAIVNDALSRWGRVDILVNNA